MKVIINKKQTIKNQTTMAKMFEIYTDNENRIGDNPCPVYSGGKHVIGYVVASICGHVDFMFMNCKILFHLHANPHEIEKVIDCIHALDSIEFDRTSPDFTIDFRHIDCNESRLRGFVHELNKAIDMAIREQYTDDRRNRFTIRRDENKLPSRKNRPLNASESIYGFIEYIYQHFSESANEAMKKLADEFVEKNSLPSLRKDWEKHCKK